MQANKPLCAEMPSSMKIVLPSIVHVTSKLCNEIQRYQALFHLDLSSPAYRAAPEGPTGGETGVQFIGQQEASRGEDRL